MSGYFSFFPVIQYKNLVSEDERNNVFLTNILYRSAFLRDVVENSSIFYEYQIKESDTPEIIADKLYGDARRAWIILLFNNIIDPYYDFPLSKAQMESMIQEKYNQTVEESLQTIHHYELVVERELYFNNQLQNRVEEVFIIGDKDVDNTTGKMIERASLPVDPDTSILVDTETTEFDSGVKTITNYTYRSISNYIFEETANEKRRTIRLLDKSYVTQVENEFRRLMNDANA